MNRLLKWSTIGCILLVLTGSVLYIRIRMSAETRHLFLPIEVFNLPVGLTFASPPPSGVSVTAIGPAAIVDRIAKRPPPYPLDLSGASAGTNVIPVSSDLLSLPKELTNVHIQPPETLIRLETAAVKDVPVVVNLIGQPSPGFTIVDTLVEPAMVTVSGPQSLVAPLDRVMTPPVEIEGMSESFRKEIAIVMPEALVLRASSKIATIDIRIAERIDSRKISEVRVATPPSPYRVVVTPPVIAFEIRGPVRSMDQLNFGDGTADTGNVLIDTTGLKPGIYLVRAAIQLPVDITLISATPDFFTVTISAKATVAPSSDRSTAQ